MKKRIIQYFAWLFAPNQLTLQSQQSPNQLVFEGRSTALVSLITNSILNTVVIALFIALSFQIRHPVFIILAVIIVLALSVILCLGFIAIARQPFWRHRNKISFTPEGIFTVNGAYVRANTKRRRLKRLKIRVAMVGQQVAQVQFWRNGRKEAFINAFLIGIPDTPAEFFDWLRPYALHWGLDCYDISPSKDQRVETFEFSRQGKNTLDEQANFEQLRQQALANQSKIGPELEIIAQYAFQATKTGVSMTRKPGFKLKNWLLFIGVFFGVGGFLLLIGLSVPKDKNVASTYAMMSLFGLVWLGFVAWTVSNLLSDFLIRTDSQQLYVQHRKNKGFTFAPNDIQCIAIQGKVSGGRMTSLSGVVLVKLKAAQTIRGKSVQAHRLFEVSSGHPDNIVTQFVRDSVYDRSMRIAQIIAQPLGIEVVWEGFDK